MNYTTGYTERLIKQRNKLKELAQDLIDAIKANEFEVVSNDLGNAIAALEDELKKI